MEDQAALKRRVILLIRHSAFAGATQLLALIAGFFVVRALSTTDYAAYSICMSIVSAAALITSSGIQSQLMASAGRAVHEAESMGRVFRAAQSAKTTMILIVAPALGALLLALLLANNVPVADAILLASGVLTIVLISMATSFSRIALQVHSDFASLRRVPALAAILRVLILGALLLFAITWTPIYLAVAALTAAIEAVIYRHRAARYVDFHAPLVRADRSPYFAALRRTIAPTVLMIAGEQLVTIMLTTAGNTSGIAIVAALSRFGMVYFIIESVAGDIVAPWLARVPSAPVRLLRAALVVVGAYAAIAAAVVVVCWLLAPQLLWLLGEEYRGLETELLIVMTGTGILLVGRGLGLVNYARGWTRFSWAYAPLLAAWFTVGLLSFDLATSMGAVLFASTQSLVGSSANLVRFITGIVGERGSSQSRV